MLTYTFIDGGEYSDNWLMTRLFKSEMQEASKNYYEDYSHQLVTEGKLPFRLVRYPHKVQIQEIG